MTCVPIETELKSNLVVVITSMFWLWLLAFALGTADIDGCGIKRVLNVGSVKLLDHLDAGAAILRYLVNVGALHEAHANVRVP